MSRLGKSELSYGEYLPVREVLARLDAVDEEQVRAVAADLFARRPAWPSSGPTASPTSTGSDRCVPGRSRCTAPLARGAFAVAVLVSLAVLFAPPADVPSAPAGRGQDRARRAVRGAGVHRPVGRRLPRGSWPRCSSCYAAGSELLQGLTGAATATPGRRPGSPTSPACSLGLLLWDAAYAGAPAERDRGLAPDRLPGA